MPRYNYIAKSEPHKTVQGQIEAESEQDAINKITRMGFFPISVRTEASSLDKQRVSRIQKSSHKYIFLFTSQLSTLIDSGVNIIDAMNIISNQVPDRYLKAVLNDIVNRIKDGLSLSDSLSAHPYLFSNLYSSMVRIGESSGKLKDVLNRLANFLEKEKEFRDSLRASLSYPLFVLAVGVLTVWVLMVFVIPRLVTMFEDMGQILPLPTRILINVSGFLQNYWWLIVAIIFMFIFLLRRMGKNLGFKTSWDKFKLKLIVFGPIILKTEVSSLMRTLSLLLSSGMAITPALEISKSAVDNQIFKAEVEKFKEEINSGASLSNVFKGSKFFPDFVTNIITVGEESGSLEKSLMRIADTYEKEIDRTLKTLARMLEPIIILVMGQIVGFIVLSMLLPIFQINLIVR